MNSPPIPRPPIEMLMAHSMKASGDALEVSVSGGSSHFIGSPSVEGPPSLVKLDPLPIATVFGQDLHTLLMGDHPERPQIRLELISNGDAGPMRDKTIACLEKSMVLTREGMESVLLRISPGPPVVTGDHKSI